MKLGARSITPPVIVMVTGGYVFSFVSPSLLFGPWSPRGKRPRAGAGSTVRRQKRRIIGPHTGSPPQCLESILPEKHALLSPHAFITFSELGRTPPVIPYQVSRTGIRPGTWTARTALLPRAGSAGADRRGTARSRGTLRPMPALSGFCAIWISGVMRERRGPPSTPTTTYSPAHR